MATPVVIREARRPMAARYEGEFGEIGFTDQDRRQLIELGVHFKSLSDTLNEFRLGVERRLTRLEDGAAYKTDMLKLETELRRELSEKADVSQLSDKSVAKLDADFSQMREQLDGIKLKLAAAWGIISALLALEPILIKIYWH